MFYVYELDTTLIIGKNGTPDHRQSYKTMAAAKAAVTRISKASGLMPVDKNYPLYKLGIAEAEHFHKHIEAQVEKTSYMDGSKKFMEPVNTPYYCSPSSETYWSM